MGDKGKDKETIFTDSLKDKRIPVLTLDNKWYRLLNTLDRQNVAELEQDLNNLLRKQGKLNNDVKDIKRLKKKLMSEIVPMVDEAGQDESDEISDAVSEHKRLIEECNEKIDGFEDELKDIPKQIQEVNQELMLKTMEYCYDTIQNNTEQINEISDWVTQIRIELKKKLIEKQEMEQKNHEIYSYMHDIFGAEVVNMFDLKYDPETIHPRLPGEEVVE